MKRTNLNEQTYQAWLQENLYLGLPTTHIQSAQLQRLAGGLSLVYKN